MQGTTFDSTLIKMARQDSVKNHTDKTTEIPKETNPVFSANA